MTLVKTPARTTSRWTGCCRAPRAWNAKKLRADERTRGVPIIMLTARSDEQDKITGWKPAPMTTSPTVFPARTAGPHQGRAAPAARRR